MLMTAAGTQIGQFIERKRIEQDRIELLERERVARLQAESANRSKDQFLATVSHELRTPLTAILGWASMLQSRRFDPERIPEIHDRIFRNAQAQAQIVNDLLDVSRIVTGHLRLEWQNADVCDVARAGLDTIRQTAIAKGVSLESSLPEDRIVVWGDPARLQQAIWNLLSNAIKFTPAGGSVRLSVDCASSNVRITVSDTGIGISESSRSHLFERFWQADSTSTRVHGGLGLGLALVRHIVELHGGDVDARSDGEGCGSVFGIRLPLRAAAAADEPSRTALPTDDAAPRLTALRVLVVDDDPGARELFAAVLHEQGADVACAQSAAEAMARFEAGGTDLMIVDIGMPEEDGYSLLRRVRAYEAARGWPSTPAVAVTAYASSADRVDALCAGFVAHVPKPVLPETIVAVVQRQIEGR
jgi:CheY-like chemotaxis protein